MKTAEFLKRVRSRMTPETWTKGTIARSSDGTGCTSTNDAACMYCLHGYILRTFYSISFIELAGFAPDESFLNLIRASNPQIPKGNITGYNDDPATTFEDVVAVIENAIQEAERRNL